MQKALGSRVGPQPRFRGYAAAPTVCRRTLPRVVLDAPCRRQPLLVEASTLAPRMPNSNEEGSYQLGPFNVAMGVPNVTMAGNMGSSGSLGATMERSRLNFVMPQPVVKGPKLDDGGSGGDIGKSNRNGGGGGDGGGDDDDYFGEGEDGDEDGEGGEGARDSFFRPAILESYDKFSIGAVFAEWMRTVHELPAIIRQAVTMGLFSSAQLVRFFAMDVRPNLARTVSRRLPPSVAREFVGRMMADPGFIQKLVLEASFASLASLVYEYRLRGDKFKNELDLALINTLGLAAGTAATVWLLAPSRSYGSIQKFPWQQMIEGLPNCVFDASGPLRHFTKRSRAAGFFAKMMELSMVGAVTGTATSLLSSAAVWARRRSDTEWQPSTAVPSVGRSSAGLAAFFAINANVRYQLVGGVDRFLFDRTTYLWTCMLLSSATRLASIQVGELSRPWWQGLPAPSSLTPIGASYTPPPRRVRKKVSRKVPRSQWQQRQQQRLQPVAADQATLEGEAPTTLTTAAVSLDVPEASQPAVSLDNLEAAQSAGSLDVAETTSSAVPLDSPVQEATQPAVPLDSPTFQNYMQS